MTRAFSPVFYAGFSVFFRRYMQRRFSAVNVRPPSTRIPRDVPLFVVANHVSWWDGFLLIELQRIMRPGAPFYTVMLESELRQHPFLERIGAIGINPQSPSALLSCIRELERRVEARPDAMIFFFPQGRIWPSYRRPLGFKRGIEVFCEALGDVQVLPVGLHIEPMNRVAPQAFVRAAEPLIDMQNISAASLELKVQEALDELLDSLTEYGEDMLTRVSA